MKLVYKGKFHNEEQLPKGSLPKNAVKFREPETPAKLNLVACLFCIPVLILIIIAVFIKGQIFSDVKNFKLFNIWGLFLSILMIVPHELLHAIAFPREAEVQVWYSPKNLMAFVVSTYPTSKGRFIFLSLLPSMVFGLIPLIAWIFIPQGYTKASETLVSFASFSLLMGSGDFVNVFNAATQMPKNSITQLSGFHSYWYLPE